MFRDAGFGLLNLLIAPFWWVMLLPTAIHDISAVRRAWPVIGARSSDELPQVEMRLREALPLLGWPDAFMSLDGRDGRITRRHGQYGLEPWWRCARWWHPSAFFPIQNLLEHIGAIRFDSVLRGDRGFEGLLEPPADAGFPYDEWLEIFSPIDYRGSAFRGGRLFGATKRHKTYISDILVLCFMHEVSIRLRR